MAPKKTKVRDENVSSAATAFSAIDKKLWLPGSGCSGALDYMEQAIKAESAPSDVLYEHAGDICYKLGDVERALNYWKQALELQRKAESVEPKLERKVKLKKM